MADEGIGVGGPEEQGGAALAGDELQRPQPHPAGQLEYGVGGAEVTLPYQPGQPAGVLVSERQPVTFFRYVLVIGLEPPHGQLRPQDQRQAHRVSIEARRAGQRFAWRGRADGRPRLSGEGGLKPTCRPLYPAVPPPGQAVEQAGTRRRDCQTGN
jgi:hypothetical protein